MKDKTMKYDKSYITDRWRKNSLLCFDEISQSAGCEYYTRQIFMLSFQSFVYVTVDNIRIKKSWPLLSLVYCSTDSVQTNLQN